MRRQMWTPEIGAWGNGQIPAHFALVAQVEGRVTADQLRDAVTRLTRRHPLLAARVVAEPDFSYWFETDGAAPIDPQVLPREDETSWLTATVQTVGPPFDTVRGPLARVTLLQSPERSDIILAMHHCVGDGLSAACTLHDLLALLGDPALDLPPLNVPGCPADLLPRWIRLLARMAPLRLAFPGLRRGSDTTPMADFIAKQGAFHILAWTLPSDRTQALVSRSRAEKVSVHSALSTAFLRAWGAVTGGEAHTASNPVSLREYFTEPVGMALGNMIWPYVKVTLPNATNCPFWEQTRRFQADLKPQLSPFRLTFPLALMQRVMSGYPLEQVGAALDMGDQFSSHTVSISNLGRLSLAKEYGPLRLVGFYGPLLDANAQEVVLGIATVHDSLEFAMTFRDTVLAPATAAQIKEVALAQLDAALR